MLRYAYIHMRRTIPTKSGGEWGLIHRAIGCWDQSLAVACPTIDVISDVISLLNSDGADILRPGFCLWFQLEIIDERKFSTCACLLSATGI
jgi:hypothetical protein